LLDLNLFGSHYSLDFGATWSNLLLPAAAAAATTTTGDRNKHIEMAPNSILKTHYYPRAVEAADGTIVVTSHIRWDDEYRAIDESIRAQRFRL
jgi:hypothetical protein